MSDSAMWAARRVLVAQTIESFIPGRPVSRSDPSVRSGTKCDALQHNLLGKYSHIYCQRHLPDRLHDRCRLRWSYTIEKSSISTRAHNHAHNTPSRAYTSKALEHGHSALPKHQSLHQPARGLQECSSLYRSIDQDRSAWPLRVWSKEGRRRTVA